MSNRSIEEKKRDSEADLIREIHLLDSEIEKESARNLQLIAKNVRLTKEYHEIKRWESSWLVLKMANCHKFLRKMRQLFTGQKNWRQLFDRTLAKKNSKKKLKQLKYRLYDLGFEERALKELKQLFNKTDNTFLKRSVAWELSLWYANQYQSEKAEKALYYLTYAKQSFKDQEMQRRIAIMQAECYLLVNQKDKAEKIIEVALKEVSHIDLYLAMANISDTVLERIQWINQGIKMYNLSEISIEGKKRTTYDSITTTVSAMDKAEPEGNKPLVSIIVPVYNAEKEIDTAIRSIINQSWNNLEVIIVDDHSTDSTFVKIKELATKDDRIIIAQTEVNSGAYVARNTALQLATGDFVTINDADDWSHPEKIAIQVKHLINNPEIMANTSQQARTTEELLSYRRGKPGAYVFANMSSLMFRRKPVLSKLGYWDSVRFGADGELKSRLKRVFGKDSVVDLATGPLSFQRQTSTSLTGDSAFGYPGFFMGVRKEYREAYEDHHKQNPDKLYYRFFQEQRPFPVPEPMSPTREKKDELGYRHFDVILVSEFRLLGGTNMSNVEEIKAQTAMGLRTGLVQLNRYDLNSVEKINSNIRDLVDGEQVQFICYGEKVTCDVLIVRHPPILQDRQKYVPMIKAKSIKVIINQPPKREYSKDGQWLYDFKTTAKQLKIYFGKSGKWYPIGPVIREALLTHHQTDLSKIQLSNEDWVNIINVDEWRRTERPNRREKVRIGRHSRSQYVKWPDTKEMLLQVYPNREDYEIHVLGGAGVPKKLLGSLPDNWRVLEFGDQHPRDFLATLDVFVYYTHPDWIESFGRVIFEAMAVGVPVIIPPSYRKLFGEAAIYAEPNEVETKIERLINDPDYYNGQVKLAQKYVEEHFGYTKHANRIKAHII